MGRPNTRVMLRVGGTVAPCFVHPLPRYARIEIRCAKIDFMERSSPLEMECWDLGDGEAISQSRVRPGLKQEHRRVLQLHSTLKSLREDVWNEKTKCLRTLKMAQKDHQMQ